MNFILYFWTSDRYVSYGFFLVDYILHFTPGFYENGYWVFGVKFSKFKLTHLQNKFHLFHTKFTLLRTKFIRLQTRLTFLQSKLTFFRNSNSSFCKWNSHICNCSWIAKMWIRIAEKLSWIVKMCGMVKGELGLQKYEFDWFDIE